MQLHPAVLAKVLHHKVVERHGRRQRRGALAQREPRQKAVERVGQHRVGDNLADDLEIDDQRVPPLGVEELPDEQRVVRAHDADDARREQLARIERLGQTDVPRRKRRAEHAARRPGGVVLQHEPLRHDEQRRHQRQRGLKAVHALAQTPQHHGGEQLEHRQRHARDAHTRVPQHLVGAHRQFASQQHAAVQQHHARQILVSRVQSAGRHQQWPPRTARFVQHHAIRLHQAVWTASNSHPRRVHVDDV